MSEKAGAIFFEVNPRHTSQKCCQCGYISPTNRDKERFLCEACNYFCDADVQAAQNILRRGYDELGINLPQLPGVPRKVTPKERSAMVGTSTALAVEPQEADSIPTVIVVGFVGERGRVARFFRIPRVYAWGGVNAGEYEWSSIGKQLRAKGVVR